jgi:phage terminase small subunit
MKNRPPANLSRAGKALWTRLHDESDMDSPARVLLAVLAESFDRLREAQDHIRRHGAILEETTAAGNTRYRTNPSIAIETAARGALMQAWKLLGYAQQSSPEHY